MWLYAAFLAATLGADDFDTRQWWTDLLSAPLFRLAVLPGTLHEDAEVAYRCKKITGITPPYWLTDAAAREAHAALCGDPKDAAVDGMWWGCQSNRHRNQLLEQVARDTGIIDRGQVILYGPNETGKWLLICRNRVRGKITAPDPEYYAPHPREK